MSAARNERAQVPCSNYGRRNTRPRGSRQRQQEQRRARPTRPATGGGAAVVTRSFCGRTLAQVPRLNYRFPPRGRLICVQSAIPDQPKTPFSQGELLRIHAVDGPAACVPAWRPAIQRDAAYALSPDAQRAVDIEDLGVGPVSGLRTMAERSRHKHRAPPSVWQRH